MRGGGEGDGENLEREPSESHVARNENARRLMIERAAKRETRIDGAPALEQRLEGETHAGALALMAGPDCWTWP